MKRHLAPAVLARFADGGGASLRPDQREHLAACHRCQDAVLEAAGTSFEFETTDRRSPPADLVADILARTGAPATVLRSRPRRMPLLGLPLAAMIAFAVLFAVRPDSSFDPALVQPLADVLSRTATGAMVFPGVALEASDAVVRRGDLAGDNQTDNDALVTVVQTLAEAYRDDPDDPLVARWLVGGYLALDDLAGALTFSRDAVRIHPRDPDLLAASGIVAYRQGDLARSDDLLRAALDAGGDSRTTSYNLAILMLENGDRDAAMVALERLAASSDPLAARARALLRQAASAP